MTPLDAWISYVLPDLPGCPDFAVIVALRSSAIDFCERSLLLVRDHDPVTVVKGITDYDFEPPSQMLVIKLMRAWYLKTPLDQTIPDRVNDPTVYNSFAGDLPKTTPRYIIQKDERSFSLYPAPGENKTGAITMRVALKPRRDCVAVDDDVLYEDWLETIAAGAVMRLASDNAKPYTSPLVAQQNQLMFERGINRAMLRSRVGHGRGVTGVQLRRL